MPVYGKNSFWKLYAKPATSSDLIEVVAVLLEFHAALLSSLLRLFAEYFGATGLVRAHLGEFDHNYLWKHATTFHLPTHILFCECHVVQGPMSEKMKRDAAANDGSICVDALTAPTVIP